MYEKKSLFSGIWNFGPNNESFVSVRELAEGAKKILGKGEYVIASQGDHKHEANLLKLDINKAIALLGWKPRLNFHSTLDLTFSWYKVYYDERENIVSFTNNQINTFFK
jgi:CDP-glucose 4,6-dehydratase